MFFFAGGLKENGVDVEAPATRLLNGHHKTGHDEDATAADPACPAGTTSGNSFYFTYIYYLYLLLYYISMYLSIYLLLILVLLLLLISTYRSFFTNSFPIDRNVAVYVLWWSSSSSSSWWCGCCGRRRAVDDDDDDDDEDVEEGSHDPGAGDGEPALHALPGQGGRRRPALALHLQQPRHPTAQRQSHADAADAAAAAAAAAQRRVGETRR